MTPSKLILDQSILVSDDLLLNHKRCSRRAYLDTFADTSQRDPEKDFVRKLKQESYQHVTQVLAQKVYHRPDGDRHNYQERAQQTEALMHQGVDCIYKGLLQQPGDDNLGWLLESLTGQATPIDWQQITLVGEPMLLVKQSGWSRFGDWYYSPVNIKLGRRPKPEYKLLAAFHAYLLAFVQGVLPPQSELILREGKTYGVQLDVWLCRLQQAIRESTEMLFSQKEPEVFISRQRCSLCQWYSYCHDIAQSVAHISLIPGVTPSRYRQMKVLGINSVEALASITIPQISEEIDTEITYQLKQQALSILENRPLLKSPLPDEVFIPTAPIELYFDIEAEPDLNLDYLLGIVLVNHETNSQEFYPFFAKTPAEEELIWQQFLEFVELYPQAPIFHFSEYEVETLKRLATLYQTSSDRSEALINRLVDLHHQVITSTIFPVESYSLKSLANWLGFQWRDQGISGDQCICWYDEWLENGDESIKEAIFRYNEDDCLATFVLKDWLVDFLPM